MEKKIASRKFGWVFRLASFWFAAALFIASIAPSPVSAQSTTDPWSDPLNLSHSGFAADPVFVIDSAGVGHTLWQDNLGNFIYARFDGKQWSTPEKTDLNRVFRVPATRQELRDRGGRAAQATEDVGPTPFLVAGPGDYVFAFWITSQGKLFTSKAKNHSVEKIEAWSTPQLITPNASAFAVAIDARGELHVAFQSGLVVNETNGAVTVAGIYYTRSKSNGANWGAPVLIYASPYLDTPAEGEANLSVATAETDTVPRVYVAWDNRPRKQVFLTQTADGGETWADVMQVAGPTPDNLDGPFNIRVAAHKDSVVLVWKNGQPAGECSQLFQSSTDDGTTWSDRQVMIDNLLGCDQSNNFVPKLATDSEGQLYLLTETKSQTFLSVWNGQQWSQPQAQPMLSKFKEPEIYTEVIFGCHHSAFFKEQLYVLGCDQGDSGDVWVTSRDLGSDSSGLKPPIWGPLSSVTDDTLQVQSFEMVTTDDGLIHGFLSQSKDRAIYYTNWDGKLWSRLTPVVKLPDGEAGMPAVTAGPNDELFIIAPNNRGSLYYSRAISGDAVMAASWSPPTRLENSHDGKIGSVDVARGPTGTLYVAYSIPVNDERGVYLVVSKDEGKTWSEPLQLFDAIAAGFAFVGAPSVLAPADGSLHVMWNVQSVQGDGTPQPVSLYYARSEDGGHIFDPADLVLEEPVPWRELVTDAEGNLHLLWEPQGALTTVWDQVSLDGGHTWQYPHGLPVEGKLAAVTSDASGSFHLLDVGHDSLGHWYWNPQGWKTEAPLSLPLSAAQESQVELLAAIVNKQGTMMVVMAEPAAQGDPGMMSLKYATRSLELPRVPTGNQQVVATKTTVPPTLAPETPMPGTSSTPATTPQVMPTSSQVQTSTNADSNRMSPLTLALFPVALLLLGVLGLMIRQVKRAKDR